MAMCRLGATDFDLAQEFEVARSTIWMWQGKYPAFADAMRIGKETADARVERSLYQRAVGYTYEAEKLFNNGGDIIRTAVVEHIPPDVGACKLWLVNRKPEEWRDRNELAGKLQVEDVTPRPQRPSDEEWAEEARKFRQAVAHYNARAEAEAEAAAADAALPPAAKANGSARHH
jgi:hypothetical protein